MRKGKIKMSKKNIIPCLIGAFVLFLIALLMMCFFRPINKISNERQVTVTVTDKAVKNDSSESKYLVFTKDTNGNIATYEITDSLLKFRFNSSDVYAGIEVGKTYTFTIAGSRNEFLSWYPNIYEYQEVEE
jgi:hypothetical protein